jgi:hypothetical protein
MLVDIPFTNINAKALLNADKEDPANKEYLLPKLYYRVLWWGHVRMHVP